MSDAFTSLCSLLGIEVRTACANAHWQIPVVERHNAILELAIRTIGETSQGFSFSTVVKLALCSKNLVSGFAGFNSFQIAMGPGFVAPVATDEKLRQHTDERVRAVENARADLVSYDARRGDPRLSAGGW